MKNIFLIFLFLCSFKTKAQFSFGAKVGFVVSGVADNASNIRINPDVVDTTQIKPGVLFGVLAQYQFAKWFALEIQPQFVQKGGGHTLGENPSYSINRYFIKTQNLEFPLLAVFKPVKWLNLEIGPSVGFQLGHTYDRRIPWPNKTTSASIETANREESIIVAPNSHLTSIVVYQTSSSKIEYAAIVGVSFSFLKYFNAGTQYYFAFNSFGKTIYFDQMGSSIAEGNLYNRYFSFNLRYYFLKRNFKK